MQFIVGVPVYVNPVAVAILKTIAPLPVILIELEPKEIERVLLLFETKVLQVKENPFNDNAAEVKVNAPVVVKALPSVTVVPETLIVIGEARETPLVVTEQVPENVITPVLVQDTPVEVTLNPLVVMPIAEEPAKVNVPVKGPAIVIPRTAVVAVLVTV